MRDYIRRRRSLLNHDRSASTSAGSASMSASSFAAGGQQRLALGRGSRAAASPTTPLAVNDLQRAEALQRRHQHSARVCECAGPMRLGEPVVLHGVGRQHHHQRGLDLAGVQHAVLVLEDRRRAPAAPARNRSCAHQVEAVSRARSGRNGVERRDVAAVAVDDQHPLEAVPLDAFQEGAAAPRDRSGCRT